MGMDLINQQGEPFRFNNEGWRHLLTLAQDHGWSPQGTTLEGDPRWPGGYLSNDGQEVSSQDAVNLAQALSRALPGIPKEQTEKLTRLPTLGDQWGIRPEDVPEEPGLLEFMMPVLRSPAIPPDLELTPAEWFSGAGRQDLEEFIAFCWRGSFRIM